MNIEFIREAGVSHVTPLPSGVEFSTDPSDPLDASEDARLVFGNFSDKKFYANEGVINFSYVTHMRGLADVFRRATVPPGEIVRKSRFPEGMPFVPVDIVSSELLDIYESDESIDAIFIQHQLSVAVPPDILFQREDYLLRLARMREKHCIDPNLRHHTPQLTLEEIYENKQSRKNGRGWSGKPERIAALRITWGKNRQQSDRAECNETYIEGDELDLLLARFHHIKHNAQKWNEYRQKEISYREKITAFEDSFKICKTGKFAA